MPFHNIFKKENKEKSEENLQIPEILIDIHEKNSLIPSFLAKKQIPFKFTPLKTADYIINNIAIERKTFNDLQSSIISKRIFQQLKEIKQYPKSFLIIEHENQKPILEDNAIKGFILSVILSCQIPIIFSKNEQETAVYLAILAKKSEKSEISLRNKIPMSKQEQKQFILEGFQGIGPKTADALLKEFNSLKEIFNAPEEKLQKILKSKAKDFISLLAEH